MNTFLRRLVDVALAVFGGGVAMWVTGWPAFRPDWDAYLWAFAVGAVICVLAGLAVEAFGRFDRRNRELAARIEQAQAKSATEEVQAETLSDVLFGDRPEQRGLTVRQHYVGGVYGPGHEGRRTEVSR